MTVCLMFDLAYALAALAHKHVETDSTISQDSQDSCGTKSLAQTYRRYSVDIGIITVASPLLDIAVLCWGSWPAPIHLFTCFEFV